MELDTLINSYTYLSVAKYYIIIFYILNSQKNH